MDGKGWKAEYGISSEGVEVLGFVEALPREARKELVDLVRETCRRQGYISLHDDLRACFAPRDGLREHLAPGEEQPRMGKVIPFRR
jgi:hypothetical protein